MKDISCEVIRDLLPLYVDEVLSEDSRALVEEHLRSCPDCLDHYENLKDPEETVVPKSVADDAAALKKIRRKINGKKLRAAIIAAACVAAAAIGAFYGLVVHETYIPYEESGIYVADDAIRTDRNYYKSSGIYTPDGETLFLFMTTTAYTDLRKEDGLKGAPIVSLEEEFRKTTIFDEDQNVVDEQLLGEVYYAPEDRARQLMKVVTWAAEGDFEEEREQDLQRQIEELKSVSPLIWSEME